MAKLSLAQRAGLASAESVITAELAFRAVHMFWHFSAPWGVYVLGGRAAGA